MQRASRPAACMPAATASRRHWYSAGEISGTGLALPAPLSLALPPEGGGDGEDPPPSPEGGGDGLFLIRGKLAHRFGDLGRARHEEVLLRPVEGHGRDVRRGHAHDRAIEVLEGVLGG